MVRYIFLNIILKMYKFKVATGYVNHRWETASMVTASPVDLVVGIRGLPDAVLEDRFQGSMGGQRSRPGLPDGVFGVSGSM